jgi:aspartate aminotransferase-like enzyme/GNAT superfamily N-acetyltransferase
MSSPGTLVYKIAETDAEFEQIHRLNYQTFVEEIPQHAPSPERRLVDKFHAENTYLIALVDGELAGMLAVRDRRPFSLDQKLPDLDGYLPPGRLICELRLLAIEASQRKQRGGRILQGILELLREHGFKKHYNLAVISGTTRQLKLYRHMGFVPFGPQVGSAEAPYQPMYLTLEVFKESAKAYLPVDASLTPVNLLPGPVTLSPDVIEAFSRPPESHRSGDFKDLFDETCDRLSRLTRAPEVGLLMGSGTLANDVVAGQISLLNAPGLVLSNGEFGGRLADQARRWKLPHEVLEVPWGKPIDLDAVRRKVAGGAGWVWAVHCETSTGVLNDLSALKAICAERQAKLCIDAISSLGTVPVDLDGVYLASGSSGKGLRSFAGVSMVFHAHDIPPAPEKLPRYLDLGYHRRQDGVPFTFLSNLLAALHAAVRDVDWERRYAEIESCSALLRGRLKEAGFEMIGGDARTSPAVITVALPRELDSVRVGDAMKGAGWLLSSNSEYLRRQNWVQICLMGDFRPEGVLPVAGVLERMCAAQRKRAPVNC